MDIGDIVIVVAVETNDISEYMGAKGEIVSISPEEEFPYNVEVLESDHEDLIGEEMEFCMSEIEPSFLKRPVNKTPLENADGKIEELKIKLKNKGYQIC